MLTIYQFVYREPEMKPYLALVVISFLMQSCFSPTEAVTTIPEDRYGIDVAVLGQFEPFAATAIYSEPSLTSQQVGSLPARSAAPFTSKLASNETTWLCVKWSVDGEEAAWKCTGWAMARSGEQEFGTVNMLDTSIQSG